MPRKPKLPPIATMIIEGLSDGREVRPQTVPDDFNGPPIAVVQDTRPKRVMATVDEMKLRGKEIAQAKATVQAQRSAKALTQVLTDMIDPPKYKPFKRRF